MNENTCPTYLTRHTLSHTFLTHAKNMPHIHFTHRSPFTHTSNIPNTYLTQTSNRSHTPTPLLNSPVLLPHSYAHTSSTLTYNPHTHTRIHLTHHTHHTQPQTSLTYTCQHTTLTPHTHTLHTLHTQHPRTDLYLRPSADSDLVEMIDLDDDLALSDPELPDLALSDPRSRDFSNFLP